MKHVIKTMNKSERNGKEKRVNEPIKIIITLIKQRNEIKQRSCSQKYKKI